MPRRSASLIRSATMRCQTRRRWYSNSRRLQVLGETVMSCGRSSQRHPVCKTYKIPLSTSRSSSRGRPVRAGWGLQRLIRSHWASVTSERYDLRGMPPNVARYEFRQQPPFFNHENRSFLGIFGVLRQLHTLLFAGVNGGVSEHLIRDTSDAFRQPVKIRLVCFLWMHIIPSLASSWQAFVSVATFFLLVFNLVPHAMEYKAHALTRDDTCGRSRQ